MYTENDMKEIVRRIKKYLAIWIPILAALLVGYVLGLKNRWEIWVMVDGALIFSVIVFAWIMFLYPSIRYRGFLRDMNKGLAREVSGTVLEISEQEDLQDGVRVLPVRIQLDKEDDERIIYLNASKKELFPGEGSKVRLNCFGRHIKEVIA